MQDLTVLPPLAPIPEGARTRVRVVHYKGEHLIFSRDQMSRLFWKKIGRTAVGCWEWTGVKFPHGYGKLTLAKRTLYPHRVSYEIHRGAIPEGLHIDHLCRNRACCNPAHLEAVTCRENIMRSPIAPAAINAAKTHCDSGHEFNETNTGRNADGTRYCRACARARHTNGARPLVIEPGDVPTPASGVLFGASARPGATFSSSTGWHRVITDKDMRRFWAKVSKAAPDACWQWTANTDRNGYGMLYVSAQGKGRQVNAHRFVYIALVADVPGDRILEHLCLQRSCVNPVHIVPVTRRTNEALRLARLAPAGA